MRSRDGNDGAAHPGSAAKVGRSSIARRYGTQLANAIGRKLGDGADRAPSMHDAATAAVEGKDGGAPVQPDVASRVGAYLGADFSTVRVHSDPLAQQASAAMGARAFAHGSDVFLGPEESGADLGLMAHELTHVAQQGAAAQRIPQRQVQVGAADSPAEHQADQVSGAVTGGAAPQLLIVDDAPVAPGQMLKSQFIEQLRAQVTAAADQELGPIYSAIGCPYIDRYFGRYAGQPAADSETLLKRYAPATRGVRTAADMIPIVVSRVRDGVRAWRETGQPPADLAAADPSAAPLAASAPGAGAAAAQALRTPDGSETLASVEAALGPGQALDSANAGRMADALGTDVSGARIHSGEIAARMAADAGALAFAVGSNVVLGADAPAAGTVEGDALLAHELAHVAQQAAAARDPTARTRPLGEQSATAEGHADDAATVALAHLHGTDADRQAARARATTLMGTGLQLQRCNRGQRQAAPPIPNTHGADQHGNAHVPDPAIATEIGYDINGARPQPPQPGQPPPQLGQPQPQRTLWDGRDGAADFAAHRNTLENELIPCIRGYIEDMRTTRVSGARSLPTVKYATTPAQNGRPAVPGVTDIANAARGQLESFFGGAMDAGSSTAQSRAERGPMVQGTNLLDPHVAKDRGRLMGGENEQKLIEGVAWWVFQNDNASTVHSNRQACSQKLQTHNFSEQDAGATDYRWRVARTYFARANATDRQHAIEHRLYDWSEHGPGGVTIANTYARGATQQQTDANERRAHWTIFYTACHELLHARAHPAFTEATRGRGTLKEGFTEMFKIELVNTLIPRLRGGQAEALRQSVEGNLPLDAAMIPDQGTPSEYVPHLERAIRIRDGVDAATSAALGIPQRPGIGPQACRAVYFEGHVEYLGLQSSAGGHAGDPLPANQLPASGNAPIRVPSGFASLDALATGANVPRPTIVADNTGNADIAAGRVPATAVLRGCREHWVVIATTTNAARVTTSQPEARADIAAQHGVSEAALASANPDIAVNAATNAWPTLTQNQKILVPNH